jgi:CBS domain-containing protein
MTPRAALPVLPARESLLEGLRLCSERTGVPTRYLFLTAEGGALAGILSLRDLARHLVELYDGSRARPADTPPERARAALRHVLDLQLGEVRRTTSLGHAPVVVSDELSGADAIRAVWQGGRGYVVAAFPDGSPKGIFTRRDLLRVLSRPFVDLESARLANWMSHSVKTVSELDTLYGLFKSMGMEGCRHMPVVDEWDRLECVISMWEALWLLASED